LSDDSDISARSSEELKRDKKTNPPKKIEHLPLPNSRQFSTQITQEPPKTIQKRISPKSISVTNNSNVQPVQNINTVNIKRVASEEEEALSEALIRKLQEEDKQAALERERQQSKMKKQLELSKDAICGICLMDLKSQTFLPLENCNEVYHESCLKEHLRSEVMS
jgi:hypothetical protein